MKIQYAHNRILEQMIAQQIHCEYGRTELAFPDADENEILFSENLLRNHFHFFKEGVKAAYVIHLSDGNKIQLKELEITNVFVLFNKTIVVPAEKPVGQQPAWEGGVAVFIHRANAMGTLMIELKPFQNHRLTLVKLIQTFAEDIIKDCRKRNEMEYADSIQKAADEMIKEIKSYE